MASDSPPHVIIVGAGLAGALLACSLGRRGYRVDVYERRPDPRRHGFVGGRSINLALSTRGITALSRVGLAERVMEEAIPMRGRMMHSTAGALTFQPYSKDPDDAIHSVSRGGLNMTLLDAAEAEPTVTLHFDHKCLDLDLDPPAATFRSGASGPTVVASGDVLVGADGAFSVVRRHLQGTRGFTYSQTFLEHGYKELTIPPTADGGFAMEPNALHIWPRGGHMMIALPNRDRTFTCTLFWPLTGPNGFDRLDAPQRIITHFESQFGDAVPLIPALVDDYPKNPVGSLVTIRCGRWHHEDRVILVGDAAHAVVPFYGQGMNAAFEDCSTIDRLLDEHGPDFGRVLPAYTRRRKLNGDAIADLALQNFIEMRDKVASPSFLLKKKTEQVLHRLLPGIFTPLYNMVTFSNIPYAEARARARAQSRLIRTIALAVAILALAAITLVLWRLAP